MERICENCKHIGYAYGGSAYCSKDVDCEVVHPEDKACGWFVQNNTTREEQFEQAAKITWDNTPEYAEMYPTPRDAYVKGGMGGGIYADNHPHWHKFPNEKPDDDNYYIVTDGEICYEALYMKGMFLFPGDEDDLCEDENIIAWMEFPAPPKFEK